MGIKASPKQALAMFSLVFAGDDAERPRMGDWLGPKERKPLEQAKLIALEKNGRAFYVSITDAGRQWARSNLTAELPKRAQTAALLRNVLARLESHLNEVGGDLPAFLGVKAANDQGSGKTGIVKVPRAASSPETKPRASVASRIQSVALELGKGATRTRVRLSEVRSRLQDVPRDQLDRELIELQRTGVLVLYRIDDPTDVKDEDERAALHIAGYPRHILYLER